MAIVQRDATFSNKMQNLPSLLRALEEYKVVRTDDLLKFEIVEVKMFFKHLSLNSRAEFVRNVRAGSRLKKNHGELPLLEKLSKDASAGKNPSATHLHGLSLYIWSKNNIFFMIQTAVAFAKNHHKPTILLQFSFILKEGLSCMSCSVYLYWKTWTRFWTLRFFFY